MSAPRTIYASELPDGRWEIIVGEAGGSEQMRAIVPAQDLGWTAGYYATDDAISTQCEWTLLPALGPISDPDVDPDPVDIEALLQAHFGTEAKP